MYHANLLVLGLGAVSDIVEVLLALEPEEDPSTTERYLAAEALAEVETPAPTLVKPVMARITERLACPIPSAAFEAADAAAGLAERSPQLVASVLAPLVQHRQEWTRLASLRLMLAAGDDAVELDALERCLDEYPEGKPRGAFHWGDEWDTWNEVLALGAGTLTRKRPGDETAALLEKVYRTGRHNSISLQPLLQACDVLGNSRPAEDWEAQWTVNQVFDRDAARDADRAALEAVERICGPLGDQLSRRPRLAALGALLKAIGCQDLGVRHWWVMRRRHDLAAVSAVLRGTIAALEIDQLELAHDVAWAKTELSRSQSKGLLGLVPNVPVRPNWSLAARLDLAVADLVRGLSHPSMMIAYGAACLLAAGAGGPSGPSRVEELMQVGDEQTLETIALLAEPLWGTAALDRLLRRLEGPLSLGCRWLLSKLPTLANAQADPRTFSVLLRALKGEDSRVATAAAAALLAFDDLTLVPAPDLQSAFTYWTDRGVRCERCGQDVPDERCSDCPAVPDSPRPDLIRLLVRTRSIDLNWMLTLLTARSTSVREAAQEQLPTLLASCPGELPMLLSGVAEGRYSTSVLRAVLALPPNLLDTVSSQLLDLLRHPSVPIRLALLNALPNARWLPCEESLIAARNALADERPSVRSTALEIVRDLATRVDVTQGD